MVDITNLANMFSQQTGPQPLANSIMSAVIGFMMQRGIGLRLNQQQNPDQNKKKGLFGDVMSGLGI